MKIFDCFMYFDEDLLLEIRLETLFDYVDEFIIVEANLDHAGNKRKPQFNINKFLKYKEKIKYLLIEDLPAHNNFYKKHWGPSWRRENLQVTAVAFIAQGNMVRRAMLLTGMSSPSVSRPDLEFLPICHDSWW